MCITNAKENHSQMATKKPRIQVTLEVSQYELVKRLAKLQARSMSQVLSDLFTEIAPVYERVAVVLQAAKRAQASAHEGFRNAAEKAEAEIAPHLAAAIAQFDIFETRLGVPGGSGLGAPSSASGADPKPALTPAPVTRGSGLAVPGTRHPTRRQKSASRRSGKPESLQGLASAIARQVRRGPRGKR